MKLVSRVFFIILLVVFQTASAHAQIAIDAANIAAHGVLALVGGDRQAKQEKIIDQSITQGKVSGSNVTILRVKESDIKSKAKNNIIALQNRLSQYNSQYKNNEPLDIPKNDSDLIAIQNADENWPTEHYVSEIRAYKRYALQQKQKLPATQPDSLKAPAANPAKKDSASVNFK